MIYSAGGIIRNNNGDIFLIYNTKDKTYQFPKGHIEKGETPEMAAIREAMEETGYQNIAIENNTQKYKVTYTFNDSFDKNRLKKKQVVFFPMILKSEEQSDTQEMIDENLEGSWFSPLEAMAKLSFVNLKDILNKYLTSRK